MYSIIQGKRESYVQLKDRFERELIQTVLEETLYSQTRTAKLLGISRGCLRMKMQEHFGNKYFRVGE